MQRQAEAINQSGLAVLAVTFQPLEVARTFAEESGWPWPLLIDEERSLYRSLEIQRGSSWAVLGPRSWWGYLKLLVCHRRLRPPAGDAFQLGGDVLIDPDGNVPLQHVHRTPLDWPSVEDLLGTVRA